MDASENGAAPPAASFKAAVSARHCPISVLVAPETGSRCARDRFGRLPGADIVHGFAQSYQIEPRIYRLRGGCLTIRLQRQWGPLVDLTRLTRIPLALLGRLLQANSDAPKQQTSSRWQFETAKRCDHFIRARRGMPVPNKWRQKGYPHVIARAGNPLCTQALIISVSIPLETARLEFCGVINIDHIAHRDGSAL